MCIADSGLDLSFVDDINVSIPAADVLGKQLCNSASKLILY